MIHRASLALLPVLAALALTPNALANTVDVCPSGCSYATLADAVTAANSGDTIAIAAGTYAASDVHLDKAGLTLVGAGQGTTILDGAGTAALWIDSDNITISGLAVSLGTVGMRFDKSGTTISNTTIEDVTISDNISYGVTVHNLTTIDGLVVRRATIARNSTGIRTATTGIAKNVTIEDSAFSGQTAGPDFAAFTATSGSGGYVDGLTITGSSFTGNVSTQIAGVYGEELSNALIENNSFSGPYRGFYLYNSYNTTTHLNGDIIVRGNTFTDLRYPAAVLFNAEKLDLPVTIEGNTMNQDVSQTDVGWGQVIDVRLISGFNHAPVTVTGNEVTLSQSVAPSAPANYGVLVRGDYDGVSITGNSFSGGGVSGAGNGTYPPGAGVYIRTNDHQGWGAPTASSTLEVKNNDISGFVDGVTMYDRLTNTFGGLPAGNAATVTNNALGGNSGYAFHNGTPTVDGRRNWWGSATGPGLTDVAGSVETLPWISDYTPDPDKSGQPGFWPTAVTEGFPLGTPTGTPAGNDVAQSFFSEGAAVGDITFSEVTGDGTTTVTQYTDPLAFIEPVSGFSVGDPPVYYEISTTASYSGPVEVCLVYPDGSFGEATPQLLHYNGLAWENVTSSVDTTNRVVCGKLSSLSPVALGSGFNTAPTADDAVATTDEDVAEVITLSGSDIDGDDLSFTVSGAPTNGELGTIGTPVCTGTYPRSCTAEVSYTPDADWNGSDSFTYAVSDGTLDSSNATVDVTVAAINDAPTAENVSVTTDEDTFKTITLVGSDVDGDGLDFSVSAAPSHGTLISPTPDCDGNTPNNCTVVVSYTPDADYHGPDSFTYTVNDGDLDSPEATVDITVDAINDTPTANDVTVTTSQDTAKTITLVGNDTDDDDLSVSIVAGPSHGALGSVGSLTCTRNAPKSCTAEISYTPSAGYSGSDSFTYSANDGTADSPAATVTITVTSSVTPPPTRFRLGVTTSGDGVGTVQGSGIDCGTTCSAEFDTGTKVTLTAKAASGSRFGGWTGACSGRAASCEVTMSQAQDVGAQFDLISNNFSASTSVSGASLRTRVHVPGPGALSQTGKRKAKGKWLTACRTAPRRADQAGSYRLICRATAATQAARRKGRVRVRLCTAYRPQGGSSGRSCETIVLSKRKSRQR